MTNIQNLKTKTTYKFAEENGICAEFYHSSGENFGIIQVGLPDVEDPKDLEHNTEIKKILEEAADRAVQMLFK